MLKLVMKIVSLTFLVLALAIPSLAQNTKGDKPASSRETRFKTFKKGGKKERPGKRIHAKRKTDASQRAYIPRKRSKGGERAGRPIKPDYHDNKPSNKQRAWKGDLTGRRIRAPRQPASSSRNVYPQTGRYVRTSKDLGGDRGSRTNSVIQSKIKRLQGTSGNRQRSPGRKPVVRPRSVSGRIHKFYPQSGRFVNNPSKKPRTVQRAVSNRPALARLKKLQGPEPKPKRTKTIVPRSASRPFMSRKSTNTWMQFPRPKRKGEKPVLKDISGRPLRTKNYETPRQEVIQPTFKPYYGRKRIGDRPYKGPSGGYVSGTRTGRAWRGDVAGRKIRGRNFSSKKSVEGQPSFASRIFRPRHRDKPFVYKQGGYRTRSQSGEKRTGKMPLPVRTPGMGANGVDYSGRQKGGRPLKGGGSVSGRRWNNNGRAIQGKAPGIGALGINRYRGGIKSHRPEKGGGSISGRVWNNNRNPLPGRTPSKQAAKVAGYPGKLRRFSRPGFSDQGEEFTGTVKAHRPEKGGGSRSGKLWNNQQTPIQVRTPSEGSRRIGQYTGNIKTRRPEKGGGSISGRLWNNKETPIPVRTPPAEAEKAGKYPGNIRSFQNRPGFSDQGEEYTGNVKVKRRGYRQNPNAVDESVLKHKPNKSTYQVGELQVKVKRRDYKQNPNASEASMKKLAPTENTKKAGGLQVRVKSRDYVQNPNASEESIKKLKPTPGTKLTGELQIKVKRRDFVQNPNSAEASVKKYKPTEATKQTGNLQIKVKRRDYVKNPNAADDALLKLKPTKATKDVEGLQVKVRQYHYVRNPNSADEALKVREPGKAFARASDYQGNIKMQKFKLFEKNRELHPDAKFVKTNKNNVAGERDVLTNFKLWWARLFKKNETQPDHLKEKGRKPRYDKGEDGMWND
jgi:hypothetical protein